MNELSGSKQDEQMEEMLDLLESMEQEVAQKDTIIRQKDSEIQTLQEQLNESLNLFEKLNSENKAENVQVLQSDLKQTRELLQREKEKRKRADSTIEECQDRLRQAEKEKEYALTHQKKVKIPVEKPVLYERYRNCDRKVYQQAKERYEHQRDGLEKKYQAKKTGFDTMLIVLWWYAIVATVFAAIRSEAVKSDFIIFVGMIWRILCQFGKWIIPVGQYVAQIADRIPNEQVTIMVHGLLLIIVIVVLTGCAGILLVIIEKKAVKMYQENCRDVVSVAVVVTSMAIVVCFGDRIKDIIGLNLMFILLLV